MDTTQLLIQMPCNQITEEPDNVRKLVDRPAGDVDPSRTRPKFFFSANQNPTAMEELIRQFRDCKSQAVKMKHRHDLTLDELNAEVAHATNLLEQLRRLQAEGIPPYFFFLILRHC